MKPLYLRMSSRRKLILGLLIAAIATLTAIPLSRSVGAGGIVRQRDAVDPTTKGKRISLGQSQQTKAKNFPNLDVRVTEPGELVKMLGISTPGVLRRAQEHSNAAAKALTKLQTSAPGLNAKASSLTGSVEVLRNTTGALSGPASGSGADIVRRFVTENSAIYGLTDEDIFTLRFIGESINSGNGMRMVRVEQVVNGHAVFQSETRFILDRDGRVYRSTGLIIPEATLTAPKEDFPAISAAEALSRAMFRVGQAGRRRPARLSGCHGAPPGADDPARHVAGRSRTDPHPTDRRPTPATAGRLTPRRPPAEARGHPTGGQALTPTVRAMA